MTKKKIITRVRESLIRRVRDRVSRCRLYCVHGLQRSQKPRVYLFHHIPKCGGTSVRLALRQWFHVVNDYRYGYKGKMPPRVDLSRLPVDSCVCGHFAHPGYTLVERYPQAIEDPQCRIITFLRDPLAVRLSSYSYEKALGVHVETLEEHLFAQKNYMATILGVRREGEIEVVLNRYFFIGLVEKAEESFGILRRLIKKPAVSLHQRNVTGSAALKKNLRPDVHERFMIENELDYCIYRSAQERFKETLERRRTDDTEELNHV